MNKDPLIDQMADLIKLVQTMEKVLAIMRTLAFVDAQITKLIDDNADIEPEALAIRAQLIESVGACNRVHTFLSEQYKVRHGQG